MAPSAAGLPGLNRTGPRQALLNAPELRDGLFGNGERLDQDGDVPEFARDLVGVHGLFDNVLGHKSVAAFDATLLVLAGIAKVLAAGEAGDAFRIVTGPANREDDKVAFLEVRDITAGLNDFGQRLVAEDEVVESF